MLNLCGQRLPLEFKRIILRHDLNICENTEYLPKIFDLYSRYTENLEDDFSPLHKSFENFLDFAEKISPHIYAVFYENNLCGVIFLENFTGDTENLYSAEVSICIKRKYWGKTALYISEIFKKYCFDVLKITKLKALIYPQNKLVKRLLNKCGFKKEAVLISETVKNSKPQNIEIYSVFNNSKGGFNAI